MTAPPVAFTGARIFDGRKFHDGSALLVRGDRVEAIVAAGALPHGAEIVPIPGGILSPGFVDLQVNGGDGIMFNDAPQPETLARIATAHRGLGATAILPTLITDTPAQTEAAISAAVSAARNGSDGILGLHLEGPHLSQARKGAHDPALIRPMTEADVARYVGASARLPSLMITVAPEAATPDQMRRLAEAGIVLSLGHSDCGAAAARTAAGAGVTSVTHLFNAMSQLGSREPGLVGAALTDGRLSAGLIADLIHVHPDSIRCALAAKEAPGRLFLVSDAMAPAGSAISEFRLNGRRIRRRDGRLTLEDGTLAGADLDLATALANLAGLGVALETALAMATSVPAELIGRADRYGTLQPGARADFIHLRDSLTLAAVWQSGRAVQGMPGVLPA